MVKYVLISFCEKQIGEEVFSNLLKTLGELHNHILLNWSEQSVILFSYTLGKSLRKPMQSRAQMRRVTFFFI